jgi:hypothetical protein
VENHCAFTDIPLLAWLRIPRSWPAVHDAVSNCTPCDFQSQMHPRPAKCCHEQKSLALAHPVSLTLRSAVKYQCMTLPGKALHPVGFGDCAPRARETAESGSAILKVRMPSGSVARGSTRDLVDFSLKTTSCRACMASSTVSVCRSSGNGYSSKDALSGRRSLRVDTALCGLNVQAVCMQALH